MENSNGRKSTREVEDGLAIKAFTDFHQVMEREDWRVQAKETQRQTHPRDGVSSACAPT